MISNSAEEFGHVVTAMVTPFKEDQSIDFNAVEKLTDYLITNGTSAIVVAGTTGESPTLEDKEKKDLLKAVINANNGRVKIIMGVGSNDTRKTILASESAALIGSDALLVVAPYYNKPNAQGQIAHFSAIAQATDLPIILYNIPGRTGINISVETVLHLVNSNKNIVALKDSTGSVEQSQDIASRIDSSSNFRIYAGDDNMTLPFLSIGACGVISVASHIIGNEILDLIDSYFLGKLDKSRALHYKYLPMFKGLFTAPNPTCVKYALSRLGLCNENLRLPLVPLSNEERASIDLLLKELELVDKKLLAC